MFAAQHNLGIIMSSSLSASKFFRLHPELRDVPGKYIQIPGITKPATIQPVAVPRKWLARGRPVREIAPVIAPVVTAPSGFLKRVIGGRMIVTDEIAPPTVTAPSGPLRRAFAKVIAAQKIVTGVPTTPGIGPYEVRGNYFWDPNRQVWQPNLTYSIPPHEYEGRQDLVSTMPYASLSGLGQETPWVELPASAYETKGLFGIPWTYIGLGVGGILVIYLLSQPRRKMA